MGRKVVSSGYTIHQVHYRFSFLNIALLRNFNAKTNIKRRDNLGVIQKKIWGKVKKNGRTKIDVETPWFPGFAKLMPLSEGFSTSSAVRPGLARTGTVPASLTSAGASGPWSPPNLQRRRPRKMEPRYARIPKMGFKKMGSRFLRWVL